MLFRSGNSQKDYKFVKIVKAETVDKYDIAERISNQCSVTVSDVVAVLQAYETNIMMSFAKGSSVEMFNLGTLKPSFKGDFDKNGKIIKTSLRLSKIRLITKHSFIDEAKGYTYKYCGEVDYNSIDFDQRVDNMISYLEQTKSYITAKEYSVQNKCTVMTANNDLKALSKEGFLISEKIGPAVI